MFIQTVQASARRLEGLALALVLTHPAHLVAQNLQVSYAILTPHWRTAAGDSGQMFLMLRIKGVTNERLQGLDYRDFVIVDSENRTYRAEAVAIPAREGRTSKIVADRCYLFTVPPGRIFFKLRLPTFTPVRFTATVAPYGHCDYS